MQGPGQGLGVSRCARGRGKVGATPPHDATGGHTYAPTCLAYYRAAICACLAYYRANSCQVPPIPGRNSNLPGSHLRIGATM